MSETSPPARSGARWRNRISQRLRSFGRTYFWNRTTASALLIASPAILGTIGSTATTLLIDNDIKALTQTRDEATRDMGSLENFTREFGYLELARGASSLLLVSNNAEMQLRFLMDRAFRLKAKSSYMRINALLYPQDWKERLSGYEALMAEDKADYQTIQQLQALENETMQHALARMTVLQKKSNDTSERIDALTRLKEMILMIGNSLMYALTIVIFFIRTNAK